MLCSILPRSIDTLILPFFGNLASFSSGIISFGSTRTSIVGQVYNFCYRGLGCKFVGWLFAYSRLAGINGISLLIYLFNIFSLIFRTVVSKSSLLNVAGDKDDRAADFSSRWA